MRMRKDRKECYRKAGVLAGVLAVGWMMGETNLMTARAGQESGLGMAGGYVSEAALGAADQTVQTAAGETQTMSEGKQPLMGRRQSAAGETQTVMYGIGSTSKVVVTAAVMKLAEEGLVDLDASLTNYIPEFVMADERYVKITPRMLLDHSSGIQGSTLINAMLLGDADTDNHDNLLERMGGQRLKAEPGAFSTYCNDGFTLAEILVERVSGMTYTEYLDEVFAKPLGLQNFKTPQSGMARESLAPVYDGQTGKELPGDTANVIGSGGVYATAEDLCRFSQVFMNDRSGAAGLLSDASLEAMETSVYGRQINPDERDTNLLYGLGWDSVDTYPFSQYGIQALVKGGDTSFYHASLTVLPEETISCAVLSSGGGSAYCQMAVQEILLEYLEEIERIERKDENPFRDVEEQTGNSGDTGDIGNSGDTGNIGNIGNSGDAGDTGDSGDSGNIGDTGDTGDTGDSGNIGNSGDSGNIGNIGDSGDIGDIGDTLKMPGESEELESPGTQAQVPPELLEKSGWYAGWDMFEADVDADGTLTLSSVGTNEGSVQTYRYQNDGRFYGELGAYINASGDMSRGNNGLIGKTALEFKTGDQGQQYLMAASYEIYPGLGSTAMYLPLAEKVPEHPVEEKVKAAWEGISGTEYYLVSDKYTSAAYLSNFMAVPKVLDAPEGYLVFEKSLLTMASLSDETNAGFFLQVPGQVGRDTSDYRIVTRDGREYLESSSYRLISEKSTEEFPVENGTVTIRKDGETVWLTTDEKQAGRLVTIRAGSHGAFFLYDHSGKEMTCISSSYVTEEDQQIRLPKEGRLAFAGEPGASFQIQYH